ncbi:MAG TPA: hypothetical protein VGM16_12855 [Gammaproteobacteria bacterium]|jgi:hypothetical protein
MLRVVLLALALAFTTAHAAEPKLSAQVTLTVTGRTGIMYAEYRLSSPVKSLKLAREAGTVRETMWTSMTKGVKVDHDSLVSTDGQAFDHFIVRINRYTKIIDLNYAPMQLFSDGSISLFTGYFGIDGGYKQTSFAFRSPDRPVIVYGQKVSGGYRVSPQDDGTFAYFGRLKPAETVDSTLIMDPDLPAWVVQELTQEVPATVAYYGQRDGAHLEHKPFLLFNWDDRAKQGPIEYKGDTLPSTIDYTLIGAGWSEDKTYNHGLLSTLITHELAHLWNAYQFQPAAFGDSGGNWLPEGQAQTAAIEIGALKGWTSIGDSLDLYTSAIDSCLDASGDKPIQEQGQSDAAVYGCGVTFNLLAAAALHKKDPKLDFFDLWKRIYATSDKGHYSEATYIAALRSLSGDEQLADMIHALATQSAADKDPQILATLTRLGLDYAKPDAGSADVTFGRAATRNLFADIMRTDCNGGVSFDTYDTGFKIDPVKGCAVLNHEYIITAIQGHPLFADGVGAYLAVKAACAQGTDLQLGAQGQPRPLQVKCPKTIAPMPDMVRLRAIPWWQSPSMNH